MIQMTICLWVKNYSSSWLCRPWTEWWKRINCILRGLLDYILFPVQFFHNAVRIGVPFPAMLWMSITWSPEYQVVDRLVWCVYHWERQQPVVETIAEGSKWSVLTETDTEMYRIFLTMSKENHQPKIFLNNDYVVHLSSSCFITCTLYYLKSSELGQKVTSRQSLTPTMNLPDGLLVYMFRLSTSWSLFEVPHL